MKTDPILKTPACLQRGVNFLLEKEPRFVKPLAMMDKPLSYEQRDDGFVVLLDIICSQQLSVAAANSIWRRLKQGGYITESAISAADEKALRACGLSRPKVRYAKALVASEVDYVALRSLPSKAVIARLVAVKGIGPWTAQIYAMFSLGRADVFANGDLALQEATRMLFNLKKRPNQSVMAKMAKPWSPWRTVAAQILWGYYRTIKKRKGIR